MASDDGASSPAKKANLLGPHSIKHLLDETISDVVKGKGYAEDARLSNWKLAIGASVMAVALLAQLYPDKCPRSRDFLLCIALYVALNVVLQIVSHTKEKSAVLFTYPPAGSVNSTRLVISSKLPRFSDMYTLTKAGSDPVRKDGVLVEGVFWTDVMELIDDYNNGKSV